MINIKEIADEQFMQFDFYSEIFQYGEELIKGLKTRLAKNFAINLEEKIIEKKEEMDPVLYKKYKALISRLKFSALPNFYNKEDILDLFQNYFLDVLQTGDVEYLKNRVSSLMISNVVITERDEFKKKIIESLLQNEQEVTKSFMEEKVPGIIKNWLESYRQSTVKQIEYFANNESFKKLKIDEKKAVKKLFDFYEYLKLSSLTPEGVEEEVLVLDKDGKHKEIGRDGLLKELETDNPQNSFSELDALTEEIKIWNEVQLSNRDNFDKLKTTIVKLKKDEAIDSVLKFLETIKDVLNKNHQFREENMSLYQEYDLLVSEISFLILPLIEDKDLEQLFRKYFFFGFSLSNVDVKERTALRLTLSNDNEKNRIERKKILKALRGNVEIIGKEKIVVTGDGKEVSPTVGNWLKDYSLSFEDSKIRTTVEEVTYINQNKNTRGLSQEEKEKLLEVISFYDALMFPRASAEVVGRKVLGERQAVETSTEQTTKQEAGETEAFEEVNQEEDKEEEEYKEEEPEEDSSTLDIEKRYQERAVNEESLKKAEEEVTELVNKSGKSVGDIMYEEITSVNLDSIKVLASLRYAVNSGFLEEILKDTRFQMILEKNGLQGQDNSRKDPASPQNLVTFLRYILENLLGYSPEDSAKIGMGIVNLMRQSGDNRYNNVVYFDEAEGKFSWFV